VFGSRNGPRIAGIAAVAALLSVTLTDVFVTSFWDDNSMLTDVVSNVLVLIVGVVVVNEFVTARQTRRWKLVRHAALIEFVYAVRPVWVRVTAFLGLNDQRRPLEVLDAFLRSPAGQDELQAACTSVAADEQKRNELVSLLKELTPTTRSALADWSPVMISAAGPSAEIISLFADFHGRMARLQAVLEEEVTGQLTHVRYESEHDHWTATRLAAVVMRALDLDVQILDRAYELVPADEWHDPAVTMA
jgi:hypothetical protein